MKGIVFTEFLEMVEETFGYETVDGLLTENDLPSGGVYTAVGTYEQQEMEALLSSLHQKSQIPISTLLYTFGQYLFQTFSKNYSHFFAKAGNAFEFLESIDNYIHVEVRKLYPDAELPQFETQRLNGHQLEMIYRSERRMADMAEGLIASSLDYFQESAIIERELLSENGTVVRFVISK